MKNKIFSLKKKNISALVSLLLILVSIFFSGCGCKQTEVKYKVDLEVWGLFDDSDVFSKTIDQFKRRNNKVGNIVYKKLSIDSYENDLRDALAEGKGPDIFLLHHTWLAKHIEKLEPSPNVVFSGESNETPMLTLRKIQETFPDIVSQDFTKEGKIYALPLSIDSLSLYYNKDTFNQAGITRPPKTWEEFDETVRKLTNVDSFGNITTSGAAMGLSSDRVGSLGGGKINRATDILTLLMMQAGANMSEEEKATFANFTPEYYEKNKSAAQMALEYYTKFSDYNSPEYCWNSQMHNSIDSFIEGKTAMVLNYSWLVPRIEEKAPKLNFGVAPVPQNRDEEGRGTNMNFGNYWGFGVSKNKNMTGPSGEKPTATNEQRVMEAWKFIVFLTMPPSYSSVFLGASLGGGDPEFDAGVDYVQNQNKPAARRDLIEVQKDDLRLSPFAAGSLIAKTWYQPDDLAVEKIFDEMIDAVTLRNEEPLDVLDQAQRSVNLLTRE